MGWPHKEDGTVDWESVFEDPDIGLIPYMERARTVPALGHCAHIIVQSLFIRAQDESCRKAFNAAIDELVRAGEGKVEQHARDARFKILLLLREIKGNRLKYARHFLEAQESEDDRRHIAHDPTEALKTLKVAN